jgi:hypothetical protein
MFWWFRVGMVIPVCRITNSGCGRKTLIVCLFTQLNSVVWEMEWVLLYSAHIHPKNAHGAGGRYTSKCMEAVLVCVVVWLLT